MRKRSVGRLHREDQNRQHAQAGHDPSHPRSPYKFRVLWGPLAISRPHTIRRAPTLARRAPTLARSASKGGSDTVWALLALRASCFALWAGKPASQIVGR